jgi:hypothetical protein
MPIPLPRPLAERRRKAASNSAASKPVTPFPRMQRASRFQRGLPASGSLGSFSGHRPVAQARLKRGSRRGRAISPRHPIFSVHRPNMKVLSWLAMQLAVNALLTMVMHLGSYGLSNASLSERVRTGELHCGSPELSRGLSCVPLGEWSLWKTGANLHPRFCLSSSGALRSCISC